MNKAFKIICFMLISSICLIFNVQAETNWTIMIYLDADNNLEPDGIDDFLEIATQGSDEHINYVVQMDRIDDYSDKYGDWTDCKRFRIEKDMTPTAQSALSSLGEVNMGDPNTLQDFIQWAMTSYPAQKYALVLWDHGDGWQRKRTRRPAIKSICWDDTSGDDDSISMLDLKNILQALPIKPVLVGFDACLMGMLENAYMLKQAGISVMVGSEQNEPAAGWPYDKISKGLASNPGWQATELGKWIVEQYYLSYDMDETQSAIDLNKLNPLIDSLSTFAVSLRNSWQDNRDEIKNTAQALRMCIDDAVIASKNGDNYREASGLSIYFPTGYYSDYYNQTDLAKDTTWNEFLTDFIDTMSASWIDLARKQVLSFDDTDFVDLHHFCNILESYDPDSFRPLYTAVETSYNFEDIQTSGSNEIIDDEDYITIGPTDFIFMFHDNTYDTFYISDNGAIYFEHSHWNWGSTNSSIPSDDAYNGTFIAPLWDDYDGADIFWEVQNNADTKKLIVQWQNLSHYDYETNSNITFQAILYENGRICFQYKDTKFDNESIDYGNSATVGVQGTFTSGLQYSYNQPAIINPFALMFIPEDESVCHYSLASYNYNIGFEGELRNVSLITENNCSWQASSQADWIQIVGEQSGTGPVKIQFQVAENKNLEPRSGKLDIANQLLTINQDSPCVYEIVPLKQTVPASGGTKQLTITSSLDACPWIIESLVSWIVPIEPFRAGSGLLCYSVAINPSMNKRTGKITINGTTVTVIQDAADAPDIVLLENNTSLKNLSLFLGERLFYKIEIPPDHYSFQITTNGGTGDCDIYASLNQMPTEDTYDYSADEYSNDERIFISEPESGTWYIMIHAYERFQNVNFGVSYQSYKCEYTLSNSYLSYESAATTGTFQVETGDACSWAMSTYDSWIDIVDISKTYHGNATIRFNLSENLSPMERIGYIDVANQYIEIVQKGNQNLEIPVLEIGVPQSSISGDEDAYHFFKIIVPGGLEKLNVTTWGGTGDCDIYIQFSEIPTQDHYEQSSNNHANDETITIISPQSGEYYIMLYGYWSFDDLTINVEYQYGQFSELIQVLQLLTGSEGNAIDKNNNGQVDMGDAIMIFNTYLQ